MTQFGENDQILCQQAFAAFVCQIDDNAVPVKKFAGALGDESDDFFQRVATIGGGIQRV